MLDLDQRPFTDLPTMGRPAITAEVVRARHRLHELELFSDASLEQILDRHPRDQLMAFTMGSDPVRPEEWTLVDARAASGADLMRAAQTGRLWFNVLAADRNDERLAALRESIGAELATAVPDLLAESVRLTLLVSSRDAMVYYHADAGPNMLFHVRGQKQLWVYPPLNARFAARDLMEDIFAGVRIENLPYEPDFDTGAATYTIEPGQLIAWPQNAPHRVRNVDSFNVSLVAEFVTQRSRRRVLTWAANRFLSRTLHLPAHSPKELGVSPSAKRFTYRVARKVRVDRAVPKHEFVTDLRIDASSPSGVERLGETIHLAF